MNPFDHFMRPAPTLAIVFAFLAFTDDSCGQFTTVINVPPDLAPESVGADTQLNLSVGGEIGESFDANSGSEVNITGGSVGNRFRAGFGSTVNISDGRVGSFFEADEGSLVNISGGSFERDFRADSDSVVNITGGSFGSGFRNRGGLVQIHGGSFGDGFDAMASLYGNGFRVNGQLLPGLETPGATLAYQLPRDSTLSGTLADGTPFVFSYVDGDRVDDPDLMLVAASPVVGPALISVPADPLPLGVHDGQTINVNDGATVPDDFNAGWGSIVNVLGGEVGANLEAAGAEINISGGTVGNDLDAFDDSHIRISSGSIGNDFEAYAGSVFEISGGSVGTDFTAYEGATIHISGGFVAERFSAREGSVVNMTGGRVGHDFLGYEVNLSGGTIDRAFNGWLAIQGADYRLDGELIDVSAGPLEIEVPRGSALSGTLADGTPFSFVPRPSPSLRNFPFDTLGKVTLSHSQPPEVQMGQISAPGEAVPVGIRARQTLLVNEGAVVPTYFTAGWDSTLIVQGGEVGHGLEATGTQIILTDGAIGDLFYAFSGTTVDVQGGSIGKLLFAFQGSTVNINGGFIDQGFRLFGGATANIAGGVVAEQFVADEGSRVILSDGQIGQDFAILEHSLVTISGGTIGHEMRAEPDTTINMTGGEIGENSRTSGKLELFGGTIRSGFFAALGAVINQSGGHILDDFTIARGGTANISGGTIGDNLNVRDEGTTFSLIGREFWLDGKDLTSSLAHHVPWTIDDRDVVLNGILLDGTPFRYFLGSTNTDTEGYFDPEATLTITLVPEPGSLAAVATCVCANLSLRKRRKRRQPGPRNH